MAIASLSVGPGSSPRQRGTLSLNDRLEVRETFAGFAFEEVETTYVSNAKHARRAAELLISNG